MFSGIIQQKGHIKCLSSNFQNRTHYKKSAGKQILIICNLKNFAKLSIGESIAIDGVCLTVINKTKQGFIVDVSPETIAICQKNMFIENKNSVNLERAMRYGDFVGGHLVSGHIDGVGKVIKIKKNKEFTNMVFKVPRKLKRFMVIKGCIAVNGVSLTVNKVTNNKFSVMLIPHTLKETNLGELKIGHLVNLESDLLARYLIYNQKNKSK